MTENPENPAEPETPAEPEDPIPIEDRIHFIGQEAAKQIYKGRQYSCEGRNQNHRRKPDEWKLRMAVKTAEDGSDQRSRGNPRHRNIIHRKRNLVAE